MDDILYEDSFCDLCIGKPSCRKRPCVCFEVGWSSVTLCMKHLDEIHQKLAEYIRGRTDSTAAIN